MQLFDSFIDHNGHDDSQDIHYPQMGARVVRSHKALHLECKSRVTALAVLEQTLKLSGMFQEASRFPIF